MQNLTSDLASGQHRRAGHAK